MTLGIGIVTYNRVSYLSQVITAVLEQTSYPYFLVVADDGSSDGTRELVEKHGISCVGERNRGIAWNKNRALFTLANYTDATSFILLEDDTLPTTSGWEGAWIKTSRKYGYCTYAHPKVKDAVLTGTGTPEDPYGCTKITSQCLGVTRQAVETVGYLDTRFHGYGIEDGEWSTRLRASGFGIVRVPTGDTYIKANCMIEGDVETLDVASYRDNASVERNRKIFAEIRDDPIPRPAWRSEEEHSTLIGEIEDALRRTPLTLRDMPSPSK